MKKFLVISFWCLVGTTTGCTGAKSPSDIAKDACKAAMVADPFVQQLIPTWGPTVDAVASAVCMLPNIISLFETLPAANAQQQAEASLKSMASAYKP